MSTFTARYDDVRARTRLCLDGRWLAVSEEGSKLRIAVVGSTEEEAKEKFRSAIAAWESIWTDSVVKRELPVTEA